MNMFLGLCIEQRIGPNEYPASERMHYVEVPSGAGLFFNRPYSHFGFVRRA